VKGSLPVTKTSWGIHVGDVQFSQSREYIVLIPDSHANDSATLTYRPFNAAEDKPSTPQHPTLHLSNTMLLCSISSAPSLPFPKPIICFNPSKAASPPPPPSQSNDAQALAKDILREDLALKADNLSRWDKHYLPFLARAHQRQQSGNFKDPGLQVHGCNSVLFLAERDKLDTAFYSPHHPNFPFPCTTITPPHGGYAEASTHVKGKGGFGGLFGSIIGKREALPLPSWKGYNSSAGRCFAGECIVKVPGGGAKERIEQLTRGMEIESTVGPRTVAAVPSGETLLCRIMHLR